MAKILYCAQPLHNSSLARDPCRFVDSSIVAELEKETLFKESVLALISLEAESETGPIYRFLAGDHARLDAVLRRAFAGAEKKFPAMEAGVC